MAIRAPDGANKEMVFCDNLAVTLDIYRSQPFFYFVPHSQAGLTTLDMGYIKNGSQGSQKWRSSPPRELYLFLSDPGLIIVYACQSLTD